METDWNWARDDSEMRSPDGRGVAFRRLVGDRDLPVGLLFFAKTDRSSPQLVGANQLRAGSESREGYLRSNAVPVCFFGNELIYWQDANLLSADLSTPDETKLLASYAWSPSVSPSGNQLAYLSSAKESDGTLWIVSADGILRRQITHTRGYNAGHATHWADEGTIYFELDRGKGHDETWMIKLKKGVPQRLGDGQLHNFIKD